MIARKLYKKGSSEIICRYVSEYERHSILAEAHVGVIGGHYAGKETS